MTRSLLVLSLWVALAGCDKGPDGKSDDGKSDAAKSDDAKPDEPQSDDAASADTKLVDGPPDPAKVDQDTWMDFESDDDDFKVKFPAAPKKESMPIPTAGGSVPSNAYMATLGETQFVGVTVLDVPETLLGQFDAEGGLTGARDGMLNNVGATLVSEKHIQFAGHDARAIVGKVTVEGMAMRIEARIFWLKPRMYSLIAVAPEDTPVEMATKFFDSFSLTGAD